MAEGYVETTRKKVKNVKEAVMQEKPKGTIYFNDFMNKHLFFTENCNEFVREFPEYEKQLKNLEEDLKQIIDKDSMCQTQLQKPVCKEDLSQLVKDAKIFDSNPSFAEGAQTLGNQVNDLQSELYELHSMCTGRMQTSAAVRAEIASVLNMIENSKSILARIAAEQKANYNEYVQEVAMENAVKRMDDPDYTNKVPIGFEKWWDMHPPTV